ncbi:hypothetical protein [Desulfosarcina widdelii]|uniref:hypothetical protein n=1 Tax=Desulfosarcina widdelii TaxID=947919 RepID=UPI0012D306BB|nr:hypothetical protein [Desulfosarcina widdelii]
MERKSKIDTFNYGAKSVSSQFLYIMEGALNPFPAIRSTEGWINPRHKLKSRRGAAFIIRKKSGPASFEVTDPLFNALWAAGPGSTDFEDK